MGFGWEKKNFAARKKRDLWKRLLIVYRRHKVDFKWIKAIIIIFKTEM
jgi:ribonuclease HI